MNLDLRLPMGLMFLIIGAILSVYGLITQGSAMYEKSAGININLIWGLIMLAFGGVMFFLGRRQKLPVEQIEGTTRPLGRSGH